MRAELDMLGGYVNQANSHLFNNQIEEILTDSRIQGLGMLLQIDRVSRSNQYTGHWDWFFVPFARSIEILKLLTFR